MKGWGKFLIIFGIICAISALNMDTSVETGLGGRVNNIGLMNFQSNLLMGAGITFISGILLIGFSTKSEPNAPETTRTCPYCAEQVKAQAIICRFCQKDLPMLKEGRPVKNNYAIKCPHCSTKVELSEVPYENQVIRCSNCQKRFAVHL
jgi:predicted Zn finger-like uncharacterized protein